MGGVFKRAVVKRASGESVSPMQAALAAAVAGAATAALTYRAMRS